MFSEEFNKVGQAALGKIKFLRDNKFGYLVSSALAGFYVGLGIMLIFTIGGLLSSAGAPATKIVMGLAFGVALSLVIFAGSELFTGNNFIMTIGVFKKTVTTLDAIKIWVYSFIGNLVGSVIGGYLFYAAGLGRGTTAKFIGEVATTKMNLPVHELLTRGILCNIMVCLAIWCTFRMKEEIGKLVMIFWCLFVFITAGFEHSVANMTLLAISLFIPHPETVTLGGYIYNVGIVTLGNFIGGVFLAISYYFISKEK